MIIVVNGVNKNGLCAIIKPAIQVYIDIGVIIVQGVYGDGKVCYIVKVKINKYVSDLCTGCTYGQETFKNEMTGIDNLNSIGLKVSFSDIKC